MMDAARREAPVNSGEILAATGVHAFYGPSHILRGVTLKVRRGETVALMGRNGMGKSTLIRTIMGLVPAADGRIVLAGVEATRLPTFAHAQLGIAYVPEGRGIFGTLTVAENLEIAARAGPDGAMAWTIPRVLELFPRLAERRANRGDQLSGGEQQMLAIALGAPGVMCGSTQEHRDHRTRGPARPRQEDRSLLHGATSDAR
jgi:branched-chain amino acid transport system ATP-binding protein